MTTTNDRAAGSPAGSGPVWPANQKIETFMRDPTVLVTDFDDTGDYHPGLIQRILELENDPEFSQGPLFGGRKILHVDRWNCPEADLVHARALDLFRRICNKPNPEVDLCWASVSRAGDYLGPHSHTRCVGSIVYAVQPGDQDPTRPLLGKLSFVDPRLQSFCPDEEGCMTHEITPTMAPGCMVLFPAQLLHYVHPYFGTTPRITMTWNLR